MKRFASNWRPGCWLYAFLTIISLFTAPIIISQGLTLWQTRTGGAIAPLFTPQVQHWQGDIARWSQQYSLDPNLLATVMQIESCGHPTVSSSAGAQGLFQVMPFHFDAGEAMLDPDTNALRSANFLHECLTYSNGDIGLTLACYNGGPSVVRRNFASWHAETQRYYVWGLGIYMDAITYSHRSETLDQWLRAGGSNLCQRAAVAQRH